MSQAFGARTERDGGPAEHPSARGAAVGAMAALVPLFGLIASLSASDSPLTTTLAAACALALVCMVATPHPRRPTG
ncbi:hypothetical protein [Streptomyces sp. NPDC015125]|uniref:hypothetical protein n=1 Tax=Streptomyces sp. NPDC015125 TaxID=3364938 RepID=UPI0036FA2D2B